MESETSPLEPRASVSGVEHNGTALPDSPLARSDWDGIVMGTLAELSELAGSEALATGFNPEVTASDSDYELDDGWEQVTVGVLTTVGWLPQSQTPCTFKVKLLLQVF